MPHHGDQETRLEAIKNHLDHGDSLAEQGQYGKALDSYWQAIGLESGNALAHFKIACTLEALGRTVDSEIALRKVLTIEPRFTAASYNLAHLLEVREQFDEALHFYRRALDSAPELAAAHNNVGAILRSQGDLGAAADSYQKAIELKPNYTNALCNLAEIYMDLHDFEAAAEGFDKVLAIDPNHAIAALSKALLLLSQDDYCTGWEIYEARLRVPQLMLRPSVLPRWNGEPDTGSSLYVQAEQGIGDEVMFSRFIENIGDLDMTATIECDERLKVVMQRSFPKFQFVSRTEPEIQKKLEGDHSFSVPMQSLPMYFCTSSDSLAGGKAYLKPGQKKAEELRLRYVGESGNFVVGLAWRGGALPLTKRRRSLTLLDFLPILQVPDVSFVNLQYGNIKNECEELNECCGDAGIIIDSEVDPLTNLDLFTSQVAACDLVISVDNSTVHFAGALGVNVWTLLPWCCDWRWMQDRDDTPWYSSMRLFRQSSRGSWVKPIRRVADELHQLIAPS